MFSQILGFVFKKKHAKQWLNINLCVSVASYDEGKIILLVSKTLDGRLNRKKAVTYSSLTGYDTDRHGYSSAASSKL